MPTWRVDVNDPVVLIEDVARMVGYDQIPVAPQPSMPSVGVRVLTDRLRQVVSDHLVSAGFYECRNPSLESPKMSGWLGDAGDSITVSNWATREMSVLRRTLLSGLAATVQTNVRRGAQSVWFFEVDRLFGRGGPRAGWRRCADGPVARRRNRGGPARAFQLAFRWNAGRLLHAQGNGRGPARDAWAFGTSVFQPANRQPFVAGTAAEVSLERPTVDRFHRRDRPQGRRV